MSIEHSCTSSAPKAVASAEAGHVKGKSKGHTSVDAGTPDTGDFSSLLLQLGTDEIVAVVADPDPAAPVPAQDEALPDPALLLTQALQLQADLPKALEIPLTVTSNLAANAKLSVSETDLLSAKTGAHRSGGVPSPDLETAQAKTSKLLTPEQDSGKSPALTDVGADTSKTLPMAKRGAASSHSLGLEEASSGSDKARLADQALANKLVLVQDRISQSSALPQLIGAAGTGEPGIRQMERWNERTSLKQIGGSEGGAWGHQALVEAGRIDAPVATTATAGLTPEMMVAEQVNYWIGRDVQNAELKLDGLGEGTVKVHISLQGNEARVEFRTDELKTRQALEGAASHLKDLLSSQGLLLSGVTVGSSGSGRSGNQEGKPRQNNRQTLVAVPELKGADNNLRPGRLSGRTVDLFV
jgi:flagellar hook-length control protein FliK